MLAQVCLLQDTYWYEFLYSRVLARKGYFAALAANEESDRHYAFLEEQFVRVVVEYNQRVNAEPRLEDEFALAMLYYLPDTPLETKEKRCCESWS